MSVLKIKDQNGNWQDIPAIKGADGAIQYKAGTNIEIKNNTISTTGLNENQVQDLIDTSIEALGELGFTPTVVEELPTENIDEHTIYLVPKQDSEQEDAYDEWLYINNAWEHIGSTTIDLSNYYTKSEVDGKIQPIYTVTITDANDISNVHHSSQMKTQIGNIVTEVYKNGYSYFTLILCFFPFPDIPSMSGRTFIFNANYNSFPNIQNKPTAISFVNVGYAVNGFKPNDLAMQQNVIGFSLTWDGDVASVSSSSYSSSYAKILTTTNTSSYTPTSQYHPATKGYVDTAISSAITDALGGSY